MLGAAAIIVGMAAGCKRETEQEQAAPNSDEAPNTSLGVPEAPAEVQPQTLQVPPDADAQTVVEELNRELRRWVMRNRRKPANFEEFVSTAQMQVPPPPPGKKYTLTSRMRIELVDR